MLDETSLTESLRVVRRRCTAEEAGDPQCYHCLAVTQINARMGIIAAPPAMSLPPQQHLHAEKRPRDQGEFFPSPANCTRGFKVWGGMGALR